MVVRVETTPGRFEKKTVLVNSGAEAVENGVKIARKHTGRRAVAVLDHAYHGRTNLTMAMNFKAMPYSLGFGPFAGEVYRAPMSYPFRDGLSGAEAAARAIDVLDKQVGGYHEVGLRVRELGPQPRDVLLRRANGHRPCERRPRRRG